MVSDPVMRAIPLTWDTISSEGRLITHCFVRIRLIVVWDAVSRPNRQRCPNQNADEMGEMFAVPSSFSVDIKTTGVPMYKMAGDMVRCTSVIMLNWLRYSSLAVLSRLS